MRAQNLVDIFSALDPNEEVWITWLTKAQVTDMFSEIDYRDENDDPIDLTPLITDDVVKEVYESIDNQDYVWEQFNETYCDIVRDKADELIEQNNKDKELWEG